MRPPTILTRSSEAFQQLAAGGSEDRTSRGALFEMIAQDFQQFLTWWRTESKLVNANYTVTDADHTIRVDASGGARTILLPPAASVTGMVLVVKKIDSSANAAIVDGNAAETIDGALTFNLATQNVSVTIQSNGTGWDVVTAGTVPGPAGPQGLQGNMGPPGLDGRMGPTGSIGSPGIRGLDGTIGRDGLPGPMGPTGPTGAMGMQGVPGQAGRDGTAGLTNLDGGEPPTVYGGISGYDGGVP